MTRVLVTGAGGRIGRSLVPMLRTAGFEVVAWGSSRSSLRAVSIGDAQRVGEAMAASVPDAVVHLAALTSGASADVAATNVGGTSVVAAAAAELGVRRVVLASTGAVYGDRGDGPSDESDPVAPQSDYARSKVEAEELVAAGPYDTIALRIFNVYGPDFGSSLVERLRTGAAPIEFRGLDSFVRDYVHVDDVAAALTAAVGSRLDGHHVVNIGSGVGVSNRDLLALAPRLGSLDFRVVPASRSVNVGRVERARMLLDWRPRADLADYLGAPS